MKTILYNTQTQEVKHHAKEGFYKVGEKYAKDHPILLPQHIVELEVVNEQRPEFNNQTHKVTSELVADLANGTYGRKYNVVPKTQYEIDIEVWKYPQYALRLDINKAVLIEHPGLAVKLLLIKGFPFEENETTYSVWVNEIDTEDIQAFNGLKAQNKITEHDRPETPPAD